MASVGQFKGLYDGSKVGVKGEEVDVPGMTGFVALLMWRFAYWGRQTSIENKILIPMYWLKSFYSYPSRDVMQIPSRNAMQIPSVAVCYSYLYLRLHPKLFHCLGK